MKRFAAALMLVATPAIAAPGFFRAAPERREPLEDLPAIAAEASSACALMLLYDSAALRYLTLQYHVRAAGCLETVAQAIATAAQAPKDYDIGASRPAPVPVYECRTAVRWDPEAPGSADVATAGDAVCQAGQAAALARAQQLVTCFLNPARACTPGV